MTFIGSRFINFFPAQPPQQQAAPQPPQPPPLPPVPAPDDHKEKNAFDYYDKLMKSKLSTAGSLSDVYAVAQDVFDKMEHNKNDAGKNTRHHVQERANDHEHKRLRQDLAQLVTKAIQDKGGNPGAYATEAQNPST